MLLNIAMKSEIGTSSIQTQLVGATEKATEKRSCGIEITFERFLVSFSNNECKKSDLNSMVGNHSKDMYTITPKDKELEAKFVRPYPIRSLKYELFNYENRIYYYTIRLYNGETLVDELKLENKGQQEIMFSPAVTLDRIGFQG